MRRRARGKSESAPGRLAPLRGSQCRLAVARARLLHTLSAPEFQLMRFYGALKRPLNGGSILS